MQGLALRTTSSTTCVAMSTTFRVTEFSFASAARATSASHAMSTSSASAGASTFDGNSIIPYITTAEKSMGTCQPGHDWPETVALLPFNACALDKQQHVGMSAKCHREPGAR